MGAVALPPARLFEILSVGVLKEVVFLVDDVPVLTKLSTDIYFEAWVSREKLMCLSIAARRIACSKLLTAQQLRPEVVDVVRATISM